jgi:hypothetical protein
VKERNVLNRQNRVDAAMSKAYACVNAWEKSPYAKDKLAPYLTTMQAQVLQAIIFSAMVVFDDIFETYKFFSPRRRPRLYKHVTKMQDGRKVRVKVDMGPNRGVNYKHNPIKDYWRMLKAWISCKVEIDLSDETLFGVSCEMVRLSFNEVESFRLNSGRSYNISDDALSTYRLNAKGEKAKVLSLDFDGRKGDLPDTHSNDNYANAILAAAYDVAIGKAFDLRNPLDILLENEATQGVSQDVARGWNEDANVQPMQGPFMEGYEFYRNPPQD